MNLRTALKVSALLPFLTAFLVPTGAIPVWFRIGLDIMGLILHMLSYVPNLAVDEED